MCPARASGGSLVVVDFGGLACRVDLLLLGEGAFCQFGLGGKVGSVSVEDVEVARRWREVLDTDDPEARAALLAPDVEWVVVSGKRLRGLDEVRKYYAGSGSGGPENLDVEFDPGELEDLGGGRVSAVNHQVYRSKETGDSTGDRSSQKTAETGAHDSPARGRVTSERAELSEFARTAREKLARFWLNHAGRCLVGDRSLSLAQLRLDGVKRRERSGAVAALIADRTRS